MNGSQESNCQPSAPSVTPPIGTDPENPRWLIRAPLFITIYGLFDLAGICHYVGQTFIVRKRKQDHMANHGLWFRVLRKCECVYAQRIEHQVIAAYKRKGQCKLNKNTRKQPEIWLRKGYPVICRALHLFFVSSAHAAQFFDCSSATIYQNCKRHTEVYDFRTKKFWLLHRSE